MKDRAHDESMAELFREDPAFATRYLNDVFEEGDQADLLVALRQMAQAFGGVPAIAAKTHLNATQLYRTLSAEGNPELRSLTALLKAMGMRLAVQPLRVAIAQGQASGLGRPAKTGFRRLEAKYRKQAGDR